ncbi:hypothetical protein [Pseudalkalibacillus sp. JSM 102089]|uniref:hypothetical protein n=1 Tax=Pseudalkalibacillus sp. JSM 102089 TaxID=3229856 RepID=UPI003524ABEB
MTGSTSGIGKGIAEVLLKKGAEVIINGPTSLIQRFARVEEVANTVAFLASPLSSAINGSAQRVEDGIIRSVY